jgi:hypothetical protein
MFLPFTPQALWVPPNPAVVAAAGVTLNPGDTSGNITLSNGNLTAISSNGSSAGVRATTSHTTGKYYWEIKVDADGAGFAVSATVLTGSSSLTAADANNCLYFNTGAGGNGQFYMLGSLTGAFSGSITAVGNVIQVAVDLTAREMWARGSLDTNWNGNGAAFPTTPGSGQPLPATGALFPGVTLTAAAASAQLTANFGGSAYVNTRPTGFGDW